MNDKDSIIQAQKENIVRYQTRLKDVVTAYKSLLAEKNALDAVLNAKNSKENEENGETKNENVESENEDPADPSKQLMVLMDSLKTLTNEKSKMEASFLADKKNLRQELSAKDVLIRDFQEKLKSAELEKQNFKAKLTHYDRIMTDERHLKENLETQLNQLKTQFSQTSNSDKIINSLNQEISDLKKKLRAYENGTKTRDESILQELQKEMESLKMQHITNIQVEKQRANDANERNKKLTALHEERVHNLEQRLSELSLSIAHYHQLRESDQKSITSLKDKISQLTKDSDENDRNVDQIPSKLSNVRQIIDEIERLKLMLIYENTKLENPVDLAEIFSSSASADDVNFEKYSSAKSECDKLRQENESLKNQLSDQSVHLKTLQEKVIVLNRNIDEYENEIKSKAISLNNEIKMERNKCREQINSVEMDYRTKMSQLEQQLQKQRERSLLLLEEKENEIRTLKTSYELFMPKKSSIDGGDDNASSSGRRTSQLGMILNHPPSSTANIPETYMIHYSNELARKDMELVNIRKAKRESDELIRQTLREKIMIQEELDEKIGNLEQKVYYLEKMKSREGANLEYLKNVTISYLTTSDANSKRKMLNAIAAVLKFDSQDLTLVNNYFGKKK